MFAHGGGSRCLNLFVLVEHDVDAAAFAWVEFHLPGGVPFPRESHGPLEVWPGRVGLRFFCTEGCRLQRVEHWSVGLYRVSHRYMSRKEEGLEQYLELLLVGQLQRMTVYLLVPLAVFCRSGRTYPDQGLLAYSTVL